jgi:hypothetical protein
MRLEKLIFSLDGDDETARDLLRSFSPDLIAALNEAFGVWERQVEYQFALELIDRKQKLWDYPFFDRCRFLVRRELGLVSAGRLGRVLYIGSGPLPISALQIHLESGAHVDCVLRDPRQRVVARLVVEICALNEAVRVLDKAASQGDISAYDLILIDRPAEPLKHILRTLRKQTRTGCQILCRTSNGLRQLAYPPATEWDLRGFYIQSRQTADRDGCIISTLRLEPARSAVADIKLEWLRKIGTRQARQIVSLMNRALEEETTIGFPGPMDSETGRRIMHKLNREVRAGSRHVLIAEKDGVIVGQLVLTPNATPNHHHMVELTRGTIDPSFRGGGLALLAFREVVGKCEELGRELICLDVRAGSRAAVWWQHFGFKSYGLLPDYSRVGNKRFQGTYLYQHAADLKQRVTELAAVRRVTVVDGEGAGLDQDRNQ